jgi:hypothetical protein
MGMDFLLVQLLDKFLVLILKKEHLTFELANIFIFDDTFDCA